MLDKIAGAYGWSIHQIANLTLFQLRKLSFEIARRNLQDKSMLADVIRVANHGDKNQYDRFVKSLDIKPQDFVEQPSLTAGSDGFVYHKE